MFSNSETYGFSNIERTIGTEFNGIIITSVVSADTLLGAGGNDIFFVSVDQVFTGSTFDDGGDFDP